MKASHKPNGWTTVALGELLRRPPRCGLSAAAVPSAAGEYCYIRITDIDESGSFRPQPRVGVRHPNAANYVLRPGELIFARTGASVGKSYLYDMRDGELVYAGFLINIVPDPRVLHPKFLALVAQTRQYWDWVARTSARSSQPGINGREYAQLLVPLPSLPVQESITTAAIDADELIETLEQSISKKQAIKQGVMQALLAGQTRLPGFTTGWSRQALGELGTFLKGRGIKRDDVQRTGVPCIRYGELYTTYRDYTSDTVSFVSSSLAMTALAIRDGDLLFARSGETLAEIGVCAAYTSNRHAVAGEDIVVLRGSSFNPVFLASAVNSAAAASQKARLGQGDAVAHITSRALASIEVEMPQRPEQDAIAAVIMDLDSGLRILRERLAKAKAVKQGMVQELLTGRTILPVKEPAA